MAATPLTFEDLAALLRGQQPLPASLSVGFSLPLTAQQVAELKTLLQNHKTLRGLKLRSCRLNDAAAEELSSAIAFNESLHHVDLRDNDISGVGAAYLANALRNHNRCLLHLDLSGNPAVIESPDVLEDIASLLHRNNTQAAGTPPETSPRALVRFEEVHPDTPTGCTHLSARDAEVERRLMALENNHEHVCGELAALRDSEASLTAYRANLDAASQQMAMVLEMLRTDLDGTKAKLAELEDGMPPGQLLKQVSELKAAMSRLQERVEGGSQQAAAGKEGLGLLMDAVQIMESKLEKLEAGGASKAQQQQQEELKRQVALTAEATTKAGAQAEAVASTMKGVDASMKALQQEVAANTASFMGTQEQAQGAAQAVAALEEQMRTLQLSVEAMEQALDDADVGRQVADLQARLAALAAEQEAYAAVSSQQADQLRTSLQAMQEQSQQLQMQVKGVAGVEERQLQVESQLQVVKQARLPERATQLEEAVAKLEALANQQAAAVSHLAPVAAMEELRVSSAEALQHAVERLSSAQAAHAAEVASQLAALPPAYDDAALQQRVTAAENALERALKSEDLQQLRDEMLQELAVLAERQVATAGQAAAAEAAAVELHQSCKLWHTTFEAAEKEQLTKVAEKLAALETALAAISAYDDEAVSAELAQQLDSMRAEVQRSISELAPAQQVQQLQKESEKREAALADRLASLNLQLEELKANQAEAEGRLAAADELASVRLAVEGQVADLAAQLAAVREEQAAAVACQRATAAEVEQLKLSAQQAAIVDEELRSSNKADMEGVQLQIAALQEMSIAVQYQMKAKIEAAEAELQQITQRLAAIEASRDSAGEAASTQAAAVVELQQQCAQLQASAQERDADLNQRLDQLESAFERHGTALMAQCSELQEGLEAVPLYDDSRLVSRLHKLEASMEKTETQLNGKASAAELQRFNEDMSIEVEEHRVMLAEKLAAVDAAAAAQQQRLAKLETAAAHAAARLDSAASAQAVQQLQEAGEANQVAVAQQLEDLSAALKALKMTAGQQEEQVSQLEAATQALAPAESVRQLKATVDSQQMAIAKQLGELLSNFKTSSDGHQKQLGLLTADLASVQSTLAALQAAVRDTQQAVGQGISSGAAATLCQEAVRPLEELISALQERHGTQAAVSSEAVAELQEKMEGLQGALASFRQEQAALASTVVEMRGSALAVAAAVAERVHPMPAAATPARLPSRLPPLQLSLLRSPSDGIASFPLTDRTLADCESDSEQESRSRARAAPNPAKAALTAMEAQVVVLTKQNARLEAVVQQQESSIQQLEAELLCIKRLLAGGSPLVAGRAVAGAYTPATQQRFYDAESVLGDPSPATTGKRGLVASTPASTLKGHASGSRLDVGGPGAGTDAMLGSLDSQFKAAAAVSGQRPGSASFGGDITNTRLAAKPR